VIAEASLMVRLLSEVLEVPVTSSASSMIHEKAEPVAVGIWMGETPAAGALASDSLKTTPVSAVDPAGSPAEAPK
jgi:hypothetical protein